MIRDDMVKLAHELYNHDPNVFGAASRVRNISYELCTIIARMDAETRSNTGQERLALLRDKLSNFFLEEEELDDVMNYVEEFTAHAEPVIDAPVETAWLVEKRTDSGPKWIYVNNGMLEWTDNPDLVLRLSRKEDANALCGIVEDADMVTEHSWGLGRSAPIEPVIDAGILAQAMREVGQGYGNVYQLAARYTELARKGRGK